MPKYHPLDTCRESTEQNLKPFHDKITHLQNYT